MRKKNPLTQKETHISTLMRYGDAQHNNTRCGGSLRREVCSSQRNEATYVCSFCFWGFLLFPLIVMSQPPTVSTSSRRRIYIFFQKTLSYKHVNLFCVIFIPINCIHATLTIQKPSRFIPVSAIIIEREKYITSSRL